MSRSATAHWSNGRSDVQPRSASITSAPTILGNLISLLLDFLGKDKIISDIGDDDVIRLVAWRRGHRGKGGALVSPFTVNDTTEQLKKIFTQSKGWGVRFGHEP